MRSKKLTMLTVMVVFIVFSIAAFPCDITITKSDDKEVKVGDIIILKIDVTLTHRVCNLGPEDTKFETEGMKILAATSWKEIEPGQLQRKLKIEVEKAGEVTLKVIRDCRKGGAKSDYKLEVKE